MRSEISLDEKKALARQFLPTLRFDKRELYTPTNFIELFRKDNGEIDFTCSKPRRRWKEKARLDERTNLIWFRPAVYVHFLENKAIRIQQKTLIVPLIIQYWFYFIYNAFFLSELEVPLLEHPHDWEWIQLAVAKSEAEEYKLVSYSVSAHGTSIEISDKEKLEIYKKDGFHINRGSHNFASIFQSINKQSQEDTIISPNTIIQLPKTGNYVFKDTLIFLDAEYTADFLAKFSFFPLLAAWDRDLYSSAGWRPEYWTFSVFHRFLELSRGFGDFYQRVSRKKA